MPETVVPEACRVGVHCETSSADFVLPANVAVASIIPTIVDHLVSRSDRRMWNGVPSGWRLATIGGRPLSLQDSLHANDVHDGDILWLSLCSSLVVSPPPDDAIADIAASLDRMPRWTVAHSRAAVLIGVLCFTGLVAYAFVRSHSPASPVCAGLLSAVGLIAAAAYTRMRADERTAVVLGTCASALAAVAAYLAVPGDAAAPKLMLACAAGATVAILAARFASTGTAIFASIASFGVLNGTAACGRLLLATPTPATGAALAVASVAMLVVAARLAMWLTRLPIPRLPGPAFADDPGGPADLTGRARRTHAVVTGLTCGCAGAAAVGAVLVVTGGRSCDAALAAVLGLVLLLRAGRHADLAQAAALVTCGTTCLGATFVWAVNAWPDHAHWTGLGAAGLSAASIAREGRGSHSPVRRRCVELIENGGIAAVIPLACWVCGAFSAARGLRLS